MKLFELWAALLLYPSDNMKDEPFAWLKHTSMFVSHQGNSQTNSTRLIGGYESKLTGNDTAAARLV